MCHKYFHGYIQNNKPKLLKFHNFITFINLHQQCDTNDILKNNKLYQTLKRGVHVNQIFKKPRIIFDQISNARRNI